MYQNVEPEIYKNAEPETSQLFEVYTYESHLVGLVIWELDVFVPIKLLENNLYLPS